MAIAFVNSTEIPGGSSGGTSSPIDTTGANLLIVSGSWFITDAPPQDSFNNTWVEAVTESDSNFGLSIYYVLNPTVGPGHTQQSCRRQLPNYAVVGGLSLHPRVEIGDRQRLERYRRGLVAAIEPSITISPIPIDLEPVPPQRSERDIMLDNFLAMMLARELRKSRSHYNAKGSCNLDVPSVDCRVAGPPQDSRVIKGRNSRAPR